MNGKLNSLDLSNYIKGADNLLNNSFSPNFLDGQGTASGNYIDTYDFGEPYTKTSSNNSWYDLSADTSLNENSINSSSIGFEEIDDFSGGQYGDSTLKQYFIKYSDVNGDGKITSEDATLIQQYLSSQNGGMNDLLTGFVVNPNPLFDFQSSALNIRISQGVGDVDGDGKITLKDVILIQKYLADGTFEPTNITAANRLDILKYTTLQTQLGDDLSTKKNELDMINNFIGHVNDINNIMLAPSNFSFRSNNNSDPLNINQGNAEDYTFFKNVLDGKVDISYSSLGDRLVKGSVSDEWDAAFKKEWDADVNLKKEWYAEFDDRNSRFSGSNDLNLTKQTYTKEEYRQAMIRKFANAVLYLKNNNALMDFDPRKSLQDASCDYALKHADKIVDYMLEYGSLQKAKDLYQANISSLTYSKKQVNKQVQLIPYDNMMKTAGFKKYANNTKSEMFDPEKNENLKNCSKYMDSYKYLNITQLTIYNYLLETSGEEEANKYLDAYQEDINQAKGLEMCNKYIDSFDKDFRKILKSDGNLMDENDISVAKTLVENKSYDKKYDMNDDGKLDDEDIKKLTQYVDAGGEILNTFENLKISFSGGFGDGWNKFFEGFKYIADDTAVMSAEEYKMMFIAQKLEQNGLMLGTYEFGQTVGNMTPTIIASAIATLATSYFGGEGGVAVLGASLSAEEVGKITAGVLIFSSTYGLEKHNALVKGHDIETAIGYGVLSGLSEAGLETLLGSLPYVGNECSNVLTAMFKEGLSESVQEFVSAMLGEYMLGEEIDITNLSADMGKAFIFGALLSGAGYAGKACLNVSYKGLKYVLTSEQIMDYYDASIDPVTGENNGLTLQEYIEENVEPSGESSVSTDSVVPAVQSAFETKITSINTEIDSEINKLDSSSPDYSQKVALLENKRAKMIELAALMENTTIDTSDPMSNLTASQKTEVTEYANVIHDAAVANEPKVTTDMKGLEDSSSKLVGLEHNIKSISSLESKFARKLEQGYSLASASTDINDSLRYTLIVDEGSYESTVKAKLADLVRKGYKLEYWNDAWGGSIYQGLNVTLRTPDGILVELQFHTEDSFKVKESMNHEYYEISRNPSMDSDVVSTSNEIQKINQQLYVKNVGFGFNSSTVTEINQMANQMTNQKFISYTNVSAAGPFDSQVNAYKAAHPGCDLVPGTDIPKALVISDIFYIYQMGNGDLSAGLKAISNKFGEYSVQAVTARATVFQQSINFSTYNSVDYEGLATYFTDLYSTAGIQGFDNTLEMGKAGYDISNYDECTNWLSKKYCSDISAWERLEKQPDGLFGMHYFTDNSSFGAASRMRNDGGYNSSDIQAIRQLSSQYDKSSNSGLNGLGERTMIYRGIDIPIWIPGVDGSMSKSDVVSTLNSLATGTVVMGDNAFQSATPVLGRGFTSKSWKDYVEVCSCPPGTEGAYLGKYAALGCSEVEYNLQAGSGNRKIILGAKEIDGQVFIFTEMIPESEAVNSTATSALLDVDIDSSVPTFTSESDLQTYIKSLYKKSDPNITLATKTVLKYIQDKASSSKMSGALYYEFLSMYDTGLDSTQNAALLTNVINSSSELRQAIRDNALSEIKSTFGDRFGFSDAKCEELLNTLLGKDFVNCGVGAGINWEGFRTEMRAAIRGKVQDGIRLGKEAVIWSGFDDATHDTMDSKYTTISNTSIGDLTFLESVYMNWNSEATPQKASTLWGIMSEEYAKACCLATDVNGNKLNSIKFLYPSDTTNTGADLFGELFKSSELPQILNSGTIDTIVMTKTDPSDMSVVSTVNIDIGDIREYYLKYKDIPGAKGSVLKKCFDMLSKRVEEAMK